MSICHTKLCIRCAHQTKKNCKIFREQHVTFLLRKKSHFKPSSLNCPNFLNTLIIPTLRFNGKTAIWTKILPSYRSVHTYLHCMYMLPCLNLGTHICPSLELHTYKYMQPFGAFSLVGQPRISALLAQWRFDRNLTERVLKACLD